MAIGGSSQGGGTNQKPSNNKFKKDKNTEKKKLPIIPIIVVIIIIVVAIIGYFIVSSMMGNSKAQAELQAQQQHNALVQQQEQQAKTQQVKAKPKITNINGFMTSNPNPVVNGKPVDLSKLQLTYYKTIFAHPTYIKYRTLSSDGTITNTVEMTYQGKYKSTASVGQNIYNELPPQGTIPAYIEISQDQNDNYYVTDMIPAPQLQSTESSNAMQVWESQNNAQGAQQNYQEKANQYINNLIQQKQEAVEKQAQENKASGATNSTANQGSKALASVEATAQQAKGN